MLSELLNALAVLHEHRSISYQSQTNRIYEGSLGYLHLGNFNDVFFVKAFLLVLYYLFIEIGFQSRCNGELRLRQS